MSIFLNVVEWAVIRVLHEQNGFFEIADNGYVASVSQLVQMCIQLFVVCVVGRSHDVPAVSLDHGRPDTGHLHVGVDAITDAQEICHQGHVQVLTFVQSHNVFTSTNEYCTIIQIRDVKWFYDIIYINIATLTFCNFDFTVFQVGEDLYVLGEAFDNCIILILLVVVPEVCYNILCYSVDIHPVISGGEQSTA